LLESAALWLRRGQTCEAQATPAALDEAVRCYNEAVAQLTTLLSSVSRPAPPEFQRRLAIAWMNRGNALQKQLNVLDLEESVRSYDQAISLLRGSLGPEDLAGRNSLGAAWMNRGQALHRQGTAPTLEEALRSQHEAIAVLRALPLHQDIAFRLNLAGALMNEANILLGDRQGRHDQARTSAKSSLALLLTQEAIHPDAAGLALQARRALCDAIGQLLVANTTSLAISELADEAGDVVDDGLALARLWEQKGRRDLRPLAERLFYFGIQLYRIHQPQFLAEFVLESLDPERSPGALPVTPGLHQAAEEALAGALGALRGVQRLTADDPLSARLLQTWQELQAASTRLAELRPGEG
jgi:hypothetical protein